MRRAPGFLAAGLTLLLVASAMQYRLQRTLRASVLAAARADAELPPRMLWVWERPEDLHKLDPSTTGVAVLQQTLHLGQTATPAPRHQPFLSPPRTTQIAVVRIESGPEFATHHDDSALLRTAVDSLVRVSRQPDVRALQIDFDARKSERPFYRNLLEKTRREMPLGVPLEMTALVSWCTYDDWIASLPVNAATPMFFRMEPDRQRLHLPAETVYRIREPLCAHNVGVSTAEPWPQDTSGKRLFVFAEGGWTHDFTGMAPLLKASVRR